jgi:hypothetical protein
LSEKKLSGFMYGMLRCFECSENCQLYLKCVEVSLLRIRIVTASLYLFLFMFLLVVFNQPFLLGIYMIMNVLLIQKKLFLLLVCTLFVSDENAYLFSY